jgi:predicted lipase
MSQIDPFRALSLSREARWTEKKLAKKYRKGNTVFKFIDNVDTDTQLFMLYSPAENAIFLSFRGSQQLKDWFNDFNAFHTIYPYGNKNTDIRVHRGIYQCYLSVRYLITDFVAQNFLRKPDVYVVGHSLGGGLATFCAVDLQYNFPELKHNIYGSVSGNPAVFNDAGARSFNRRVPNFRRIFHRRDWVPNLPPKWFGKRLHGGYAHCGDPIPIGKKIPFQGLRYFFKMRFGLRKLAENLTNHSIELYEKDIRCVDFS